ncbi:antigen 2 [Diplonema papillatum]|nr:antigen 2 [Diplonema papillatum]
MPRRLPDVSQPDVRDKAKAYLRQGDTVEFFEKLASNILRVQPMSLVRYSLSEVEFQLSGLTATNKGDLDISQDRAEDSHYMKKRRMSAFLDRWILEMIAQKPGNNITNVARANRVRRAFHKQYLEDLLLRRRDE